MVMRRWDPFNEMRRMQANMDHFRRGFTPAHDNGPEGGPEGGPERASWAIPLDVMQEDGEIIVRASLPGVAPEDINVSIENDVLTIRGQTASEQERREGNYLVRERHTGSFHRALRLPDTLDTEQAQPRYENGVLTIAFPKPEAKQARQLTVTVGRAPEPISSDLAA